MFQIASQDECFLFQHFLVSTITKENKRLPISCCSDKINLSQHHNWTEKNKIITRDRVSTTIAFSEKRCDTLWWKEKIWISYELLRFSLFKFHHRLAWELFRKSHECVCILIDIPHYRSIFSMHISLYTSQLFSYMKILINRQFFCDAATFIYAPSRIWIDVRINI